MWWKTLLAVPLLAIVAMLTVAAGVTAPVSDLQDLRQGWKPADREAWYGATQGSRLIPLAWLLALEQPGQKSMFLDANYVEGFRYLARADSHGLPVGFAIDRQNDSDLLESRLRWMNGQGSKEPWVGMNCAACHTSKLSYNGVDVVVDGGPTLADFQSFLEALNAALAETRADPLKFDRFAHRVLTSTSLSKPGDTQANRNRLRQALEQHIAFERVHATMNATTTRYGNGRLDAFGHIFNKIVLIANRKAPQGNASDAPVSYPFLWNVNQHERVQWNGAAPNLKMPGLQAYDIGGLVRNTSEVTGVFADVDTRRSWRGGYRSSVNAKNLVAMEQLLGTLAAPRWPSAFPAVNPELAKEGGDLFKTRCSECHQLLKSRTDLDTRIPLQISLFKPTAAHPNPAPGTDRAMACNAAVTEANTGALKGVGVGYFNASTKFGDRAPVGSMLVTVIAGELWSHRWDVVGSYLKSFVGLNPPPRVQRAAAPAAANPTRQALCEDATGDTLGYKARPLNGVWATAPYLHNGSVPTLYDLLLPPAERPSTFYVGTRRFDPKKVGYMTDKATDNPFFFETRDATGRPKWGNSNEGHDYDNASLSPHQRWALVEYMKTFGEP